MGRDEGQIEQERLAPVVRAEVMLAEELDCVVDNGGRRVVAFVPTHGRQQDIVQRMAFGREVAVMVVQEVGVVEAGIGHPFQICKVPFPGMVAAIAEGGQILREDANPCRLKGALPSTQLRRLVEIVAGQQAAPRGHTQPVVVALRKPQAVGGQRVQVGRADLAAVAAGVGKAHVVGENENDVGGCCRFLFGKRGG